MSRRVCIAATGVANLAALRAAFTRLGIETEVAADPDALGAADRVVLPGVGAFGAAMAAWRERDLCQVLRERIADDRPTLGICLGMQALSRRSDESPGVEGLGVFDVDVVTLPDHVSVPHLGWNRVEPSGACRFVQPGYAYFAHSYRMDDVPAGWAASFTEHGARFPSALERGSVLMCQFHPEISGDWGAQLLTRWLEGGAC